MKNLKTELTEKTLSKKEVCEIYNKYTRYDFPKDELKTLEHIISLLEKNYYMCKGFFEENKLKSYMFFAYSKNNYDCSLLDFFAVNKNFRNSGIGSKTINLIKSLQPFKNGIIGEIEDPFYADTEEEQIIRKRRADFYKKNGFIKTKITSVCFGVHFIIIYLPFKKENTLSEKEIKNVLYDIYKTLFSKYDFENKISIYLPENQ